MINRFSFSDLGREVLEAATDLKIHVYKFRGKLCAEFKLCGKLGGDLFDDDDEDEGDTKQADNDLRLLGDLLAEFQKGGDA
jgi:hypothetical protein